MKGNPLIAKKKFVPGTDWVWYAPNKHDAFGQDEIRAVTKTLTDGWLTVGPTTKEFENRIAEMYGKKHALFVNSGSSANLLAFAALDFPKGSEIITPACNFNTTVAPILQSGLVPVFIDVKEGFYTLDIAQLEKAVSKKTRAIIAPHLIGNLVDLAALKKFARTHNLILIEDSCDTIGSSFRGKRTGTYADVTTTSFYASHLITTGGAGGMVMFDDPKLRERARIFRDWGRGISLHDDKIRSRLATFKIDGKAYDSAFVFVEQGYNMRPTEMQAAFGLTQLSRLDGFTEVRAKHFKRLSEFFGQYPEHFILPQTEKDVQVNWLAFPLTIRADSSIDRNAFARYLEDNRIQTRPLFSGNIVKHPPYVEAGRVVGKLPVSNMILTNSLLIGLHHGLTDSMIEYVCHIAEKYLKKESK